MTNRRAVAGGRATATDWYQKTNYRFWPLEQAYVEFFGAKKAVFARTLWRERSGILFRATSGTPQVKQASHFTW